MKALRAPLVLIVWVMLCSHSAVSADRNPSRVAVLNAALLVAAKKGQTAEVTRLLTAGADVNTRRGSDALSAAGLTPLMLAACGIHVGDDSRARLDTVKVLLAHGAVINTGSPGGFTPLIWAVWAGNIHVVRLLIHCKADVNANYPASDLTPLAVATTCSYPRIARLLRRAGAKKSPPLVMTP